MQQQICFSSVLSRNAAWTVVFLTRATTLLSQINLHTEGGTFPLSNTERCWYVAICDRGAFWKYRTSAASEVFFKSAGITNIYIHSRVWYYLYHMSFDRTHMDSIDRGIFITRPTGGGLFRAPPPLISETTRPILKIQTAFESPWKTVEGKQILLTSESRVTSQVRSKSKCSTFRAWRHRRAKLQC